MSVIVTIVFWGLNCEHYYMDQVIFPLCIAQGDHVILKCFRLETAEGSA